MLYLFVHFHFVAFYLFIDGKAEVVARWRKCKKIGNLCQKFQSYSGLLKWVVYILYCHPRCVLHLC